MGRKLDLSKLTDEEAKNVLEVVQRDFDLRKKEEDRLEELKGKIEKESTKRELLTNQSHLNETHCIHCLQPFKFLVNSKRECLDCHFFTCKNCSRYNKKEQGWVCDPCRLSRIVKTGSLEWYYEHVRSRFKRFGSAKVMRSLYGRLQHGQKMNPTLLGLHDRVYSLPDINVSCVYAEIWFLALSVLSKMRKTKRLLSVHPFDFELDSEYSAQSRRQSVQLSPAAVNQDGLQTFQEFPVAGEDTSRKESMIAEADLAAMFHHILQEQGQHMAPPEQEFSTEVRLTVNSRRKSLERTPKPEQHRPQYSADMDTSDEEDLKGAQKLPAYQPHHTKRRSRALSQENINHSGSQVKKEIFKPISSSLITLQSWKLPVATESHADPNAEEEELKRKLEELACNISDKGMSSEEEGNKSEDPKTEMSSSSDDLPSDAQKRSSAKALCDITAKLLRAINATERVTHESLKGEGQWDDVSPLPGEQPSSVKNGKEVAEAYRILEENVYITAGKTYGLEKKLKDLEDCARHSGTTDSELSELEGKVASAAAQVQHAESEVSDIESRIAALSAAGLTVKPVEKPRKKSSTQVSISLCYREHVMSMPHVLRKKFISSLEIASKPDSFDRNSYYRGSLTQRNPNGKNRKADRIFAVRYMCYIHLTKLTH
uniref:Melanophilin n=1 Tax=Sphenodon punctatus TaxID=8508 RepID=A0A8D0H828_SPHPU